MAVGRRPGDIRRRRRGGGGGGVVLSLTIFSVIWTVRSQPGLSGPSDHGVASAEDPGAASPAMAAFFSGRSSGAALPVARNSTARPAWDVGLAEPEHRGSGRAKTALLVAGVGCGAVGVVLLGSAALAYVVQSRRSRPADGPGRGRTGPVGAA